MSNKKIIIGLSNPKSPTNVGAVMRAAGCYQVSQVLYSGFRYDHAVKFQTDTQNSIDDIPLTPVEDIVKSKPEGYTIVGVELVEGAICLPQYQHPEKAYYLFGPEDGSLTQKMVDACDDVVYIPTKGCLNLAMTVNVLLYDRLSKDDQTNKGDELIRNSRDKNNRVKVKGDKTIF